MTQYPDLFAALAAPFEPHEVKTRQGGNGRALSYITARTAMNRLDSALGPENWHDDYTPLENSVICRLTIRLPDGREVTKCDAGGYAGMEVRDRATGQMVRDEENDEKTAYSDAFKRACVKFGVGRYLYRDGVPAFVREREPAVAEVSAPAPASNGPAPAAADAPAVDSPRFAGRSSTPKSGKALFAWVKDQEGRYEVNLLKYLNGWAKLQEFPSRMIDWDGEQVQIAYDEACRKLQSNASAREEALAEALAN